MKAPKMALAGVRIYEHLPGRQASRSSPAAAMAAADESFQACMQHRQCMQCGCGRARVLCPGTEDLGWASGVGRRASGVCIHAFMYGRACAKHCHTCLAMSGKDQALVVPFEIIAFSRLNRSSGTDRSRH